MTSKLKGVIMGILDIVVSVLLFPIILTGVSGITGHTHIATFTGLETVALILPLVILLGMVFSGGMLAYTSVKGKAMGNMMTHIWGVILIFVTLILFPVILDTFYSLITTAGATYTGFASVAPLMPLVLLVAGVFSGGFLMFRGYSGGGGHRHHKKYR